MLLEDTLIYENDTQYRMVSVGTFTILGTLQNDINSYIFSKKIQFSQYDNKTYNSFVNIWYRTIFITGNKKD